MLALNTQETGKQPEISILDFAVSKEGKLAQLPDSVNLPRLIMQGASAQLQTAIDERRETIAQLKRSLQSLDQDLKALPILTATFFSEYGYKGQSFTLKADSTSKADSEKSVTPNQNIISVRIDPGAIVTVVFFNDSYRFTQSNQQMFENTGGMTRVKVEELPESLKKRTLLRQKIDQAKRDLQNQESLLAGELSRAQGEQSVPMKLLNIDPDGLTIAGGTLQFTAKDTPYLFDSATGQLALYFRGVDDQFRAAYYDTLTARAEFSIQAGRSTVKSIARSTEAELDNLAITIEGTNPETCTVTIGGADSIQEVWKQVPRHPERFAAVLNGTTTDPLKVASLASAVIPGAIKTLTVAETLSRSLKAGDLLQIGTAVFTVSRSADRDAKNLEVIETIVSELLPEHSSILLIEYDYSNAASNRLLADLSYGSLLIRIAEAIGTDPVENGTSKPQQSTPACRWVGAAPGNTLVFTAKWR